MKMKMKNHAVGMVIKDRLEITKFALNSLFYSTQDKNSYDLFLIDNGSSEDTNQFLRKYVKSGLLPIKNLFILKETSISKAWNLFLSVSKDYKFRTKLDNDIILHNTIKTAKQKSIPVGATPAEADAAAGAPRSVSIQMGAGSRLLKKTTVDGSSFLDYMSAFSSENNADLVSLIPISPQESFMNTYNRLIRVRKNGHPYLSGSCMLITKKAFDILGYFDERLPRRIDIEYSQRAIKNLLNIGYHPLYGTVHIGSKQNTESVEVIEQKHQESNRIENHEPAIKSFAISQWDSVMSLKRQSTTNKILSLI